MAVITLPSVRTIIAGNGVTAFDKKAEFTLAEKMETVLYVNSTTNVSVPYSNIDNIKSIVFYSENDFTVNITMTIDSTSVTVPIATTGNFRLDPTSTFMSSVSAITLQSSSTTNISVTVNIYGAE